MLVLDVPPALEPRRPQPRLTLGECAAALGVHPLSGGLGFRARVSTPVSLLLAVSVCCRLVGRACISGSGPRGLPRGQFRRPSPAAALELIGCSEVLLVHGECRVALGAEQEEGAYGVAKGGMKRVPWSGAGGSEG